MVGLHKLGVEIESPSQKHNWALRKAHAHRRFFEHEYKKSEQQHLQTQSQLGALSNDNKKLIADLDQYESKFLTLERKYQILQQQIHILEEENVHYSEIVSELQSDKKYLTQRLCNAAMEINVLRADVVSLELTATPICTKHSNVQIIKPEILQLTVAIQTDDMEWESTDVSELILEMESMIDKENLQNQQCASIQTDMYADDIASLQILCDDLLANAASEQDSCDSSSFSVPRTPDNSLNLATELDECSRQNIYDLIYEQDCTDNTNMYASIGLFTRTQKRMDARNKYNTDMKKRFEVRNKTYIKTAVAKTISPFKCTKLSKK